MALPPHLAWTPTRGLRILDQTRLPSQEVYCDLESVEAVAEAIRLLRVRGAPLIGVAAAMAVAGEAARAAAAGAGPSEIRAAAQAACDALVRTRPTAVNLAWALGRMRRAAGNGHPERAHGHPGRAHGHPERAHGHPERSEGSARHRTDPSAAMRPQDDQLADALVAEAQAIWDEDRAMCEAIGAHGLDLLPDGAIVHTHCNAGALATGGIGTALAPVYVATRAGRRIAVIADETRPLLQGSRLTAWELQRAGIPVTVIADNMAASRLARGDVTCVIVGADRIAANGDVANKIGTYGLALAARAAGVPFYVAAPVSTLDPATPTGADIVIEERGADEVALHGGVRLAPDGAAVWNPAFDVTPADLVTAIITDRGIVAPRAAAALAR